jgi:FemAB-related protein (PEP-CTERM system-associated)
MSRAFRHRWYVLAIRQHGVIRAGLPLVHLQSRIFGNFLVSMPCVNYGGILTEDDALAEPLLEGAIALGQRLHVRHLELRHLANHYPQLPLQQEKVSMWLSLPSTAEELLASFKSKLRSQVMKGQKNGLGVRIGRFELLDDFYTVFAHNMRDLGTPVYPRALYQHILEAFPTTARIVIVTGDGYRPVAGGFLLGYRDRIEISSASSLRAYNHLQSNMWLYWNCLKYACEQGYRIFDFGRSTEGSSTYKFKAQWGPQRIRHYWHYYLETGRELPRLNPHNPKFRLATTMWRRLPLGVTRVLGPAVVRYFP